MGPKAILIGLFLSLQAFGQQPIDHHSWTSFLQTYVSDNGHVNYQAITSHPEALDAYLKQLSESHPNPAWPKNDRLAFWINAYNAFTIKLITNHYPIKSIKDIKNPWNQKFVVIGGQTMSLNHIEHDILRTMDEPRIHFAIVCASVSCPKLQNKAYISSRLNNQLSLATRAFLSDTSKNNLSKNNLKLSKIFRWYAKDFKQHGSLIDFLNHYAPLAISKHAEVSFKDYNWDLNE